MNKSSRKARPDGDYRPLNTSDVDNEHDHEVDSSEFESSVHQFSRFEYAVFLLLGVAMLWAWNAFLAAAPYFQNRFASNTWIFNHFQAAEISVSCVINLFVMLILSKLQTGASYPKRISAALCLNAVAFTLLALSTFVESSAELYFGFLLAIILAASLSTGLIQNGVFAFAAGFGRGEYTQAIMAGQGVAGVLPPLAQIISVTAISDSKGSAKDEPQTQSSTSAFIYFLTATAVSLITLAVFLSLLRRQQSISLGSSKTTTTQMSPESTKPSIPLIHLFRTIPYLSLGVFLTFTATMLAFPVFTSSILSTSPSHPIPPAIFIPLAYLVWNTGDLLGRTLPLIPRFSLTHSPATLLAISVLRFGFVPLYLLCNIKGRGAVVHSDLFYLGVVQFFFGATNGFVGSECMIGAQRWVEPEESEATGGFMGLMLVGGLTVGSLGSFAFGGI